MAKRDSKEDVLIRYIANYKGCTIDAIDLEYGLRSYAQSMGASVGAWGKGMDQNNVYSSANYTLNKLYRKKPYLKKLMSYDRATNSYYIYMPGEKPGPFGFGKDPDTPDDGDDPNPIERIKDIIGGVRYPGTPGGFDLKGFIFSPLGLVLLVIAICVILFELVGPVVYSFIMDGPFFKILLIILAIAAVMAIVRSSNNWPGGVKFVVLLVIGLVLLYSIVGPAVYSFLMSGALFKIICLVIAGAAVIGILKADLGWPIGIKIVVILVIWLVIKSEVL